MEAFTRHTGTAVALRRSNVDTDQIIPASYLKRVTRTGFEDGLFAAWRNDPDFVLNRPEAASASVLIAGQDFGTGSSREHAVWALTDFGFKAVLSPRFGDIFRGNAGKSGLLAAQVDAKVIAALWELLDREPATEVTVDLVERTIVAGDGPGPDRGLVRRRRLHALAAARRTRRRRHHVVARRRGRGVRSATAAVEAGDVARAHRQLNARTCAAPDRAAVDATRDTPTTSSRTKLSHASSSDPDACTVVARCRQHGCGAVVMRRADAAHVVGCAVPLHASRAVVGPVCTERVKGSVTVPPAMVDRRPIPQAGLTNDCQHGSRLGRREVHCASAHVRCDQRASQRPRRAAGTVAAYVVESVAPVRDRGPNQVLLRRVTSSFATCEATFGFPCSQRLSACFDCLGRT